MNGKKLFSLLLCALVMLLLLPTAVFAADIPGNDLAPYLDTDGKFIIRTSCTDWTKSDVSDYISRSTNGTYSIATQYNSGTSQWDPIISNDLSSGTLRKNAGGTTQEVTFKFVTEKSDAFKQYLNADGKLEIKAATPTTMQAAQTLFEVLYAPLDGVSYRKISDDFSSVELTVNHESHVINIVYTSNSAIAEKLRPLTQNFPANIEFFQVRDLELINYWYNTAIGLEEDTFSYYSGELKSYLDHYNVTIQVDNRAGMDGLLRTERKGFFFIKFGGTVYYENETLGTAGDHILYVPTSTADSKEALMQAAQDRVDAYLGKGKAALSYAGTALDLWHLAMYNESRNNWESTNPDLTLEEFVAMGNLFIPVYDDFATSDSVVFTLGVSGLAETDPIFKVAIGDTVNYVIIRKSDSKMVTPTYVTADMVTNISISSDDSSVPLDASVSAGKLTSGTEYDRIMKVLDVDSGVAYDIKRYSPSLGDYVTKLASGLFQVKIPVPAALEGKDLIVYYVNASGNTTAHAVTVKDGFAVFTTDHFSIYTLAETKATVKSPATGDSNFMYLWLALSLVSLVGIPMVAHRGKKRRT
jgi:hypothetical protein